MPLISENSEPDEIALNVYFKLPRGKLTHYVARAPIQDMKEAIKFCRNEVLATLTYKEAYNLAVLAVIPGGKA